MKRFYFLALLLLGCSLELRAQPGPDQVLVKGRLRYRECLPEYASPTVPAPSGGPLTLDSERCLMDGATPVFKPVRRARVEIWDQAPLIDQLREVKETNDNGEFSALVPASGSYDVTVVAASFAGQVNLENDAVTWFWKPLRMTQNGVAGGTLTFDFDFPRADARHFNALDAITRGLEYAMDRTGVPLRDADPTFRKTVVIPGSGVVGANTHRVGNATHIWINAWQEIFDDEVVLHEYGHHMQHANGTYQIWGTKHSGCYATVVLGPACQDRRKGPGEIDSAADAGCWVNSAELAWFEGFPTFFSRVVMDFDANSPIRALTGNSQYDFLFAPGPGTSCPLVTSEHFNHHNKRITGAFVEDYVTGALLALRDRDRPTFEPAIFQIFFNKLRDRAPTVFDFRDAWSSRFPGSTSWTDVMAAFAM